MDKVDEKLLDEQITQCLQNGNIEGLKDLIELPDDIIKRLDFEYRFQKLLIPEDIIDGLDYEEQFRYLIFKGTKNTKCLFPKDLLQEILIARDKKVLGLKKYDISRVKSGQLVLDEEIRNYNGEIIDGSTGKITVIQGKSKDGKDNVLYYYAYPFKGNVIRQQRTFNEHGDVESMHRHTMDGDGELRYVDNALVSYKYDNHGKKKAALYQDGIGGMTYYEYDKNGDVSISINPEAVSQKIQEDGYTYTIYDGYFEPSLSGYTYKSMPATSELTPDDMQRSVVGGIPLDKALSVFGEMNQKRKEEVLSILTAVEPVFASLFTDVTKNEQDARKRMDKVVTWFTGFAKRLKIDPKLATQDNAVMSTMKGAVSKTIGKTIDAETDLMTPVKDEKENEGVDYGDN